MLVELISCIYLYQYLSDFMTLQEIYIDRTVTEINVVNFTLNQDIVNFIHKLLIPSHELTANIFQCKHTMDKRLGVNRIII